MRSIFDYIWKIISVLLLFSVTMSVDAKSKSEERPQKTLYGVFVDADILHPIFHLFNHDRMGLNADIQIDLWHKLYPTITIGYDWFNASDEYSYPIAANNNLYKVEGLYFKTGLLYNIWKKDYSKALNPMAFLGVNYGCSPHFQYTIENYPINNEYWSAKNTTFQANGHTTSHWGEVVGGVKAPIAKNFCMGFEVMYKFLLHIKDQQSGNNLIHQSYSPGFGDKESGMWGFRYTISYFFHL